MNNATLQLAIDAAKMTCLLGKGVVDPAEVSFQRGRVEDAVYRLVRMGAQKESGSEVRNLTKFIGDLHEKLVDVLNKVDVDVLTDSGVASYSRVKLRNAERFNDKHSREFASNLRAVQSVKTPMFDRAIEAIDKKAKNSGERGRILHTFGSVVRNDEWMSLLLQLGAKKAVKGNTALIQEYSSGQGRAQRLTKMATLLSAGIAQAGTATGVVTVMVGLTPKIVIQHEKVAPLFAALMANVANTEAVNTLIEQATIAQEVAVTGVDAFVSERIDALVKGLTARQKTYASEEAARRKALDKKKEDDAVAALKGMGSHLAVLAANPKLLAQALEQAGLSTTAAPAKKVVARKVATKRTGR